MCFIVLCTFINVYFSVQYEWNILSFSRLNLEAEVYIPVMAGATLKS
jgi:hypothetical protein